MKGKREMQTELHTLFIYFLIFNFYLFYFVTLQYCIGFAIRTLKEETKLVMEMSA